MEQLDPTELNLAISFPFLLVAVVLELARVGKLLAASLVGSLLLVHRRQIHLAFELAFELTLELTSELTSELRVAH